MPETAAENYQRTIEDLRQQQHNAIRKAMASQSSSGATSASPKSNSSCEVPGTPPPNSLNPLEVAVLEEHLKPGANLFTTTSRSSNSNESSSSSAAASHSFTSYRKRRLSIPISLSNWFYSAPGRGREEKEVQVVIFRNKQNLKRSETRYFDINGSDHRSLFTSFRKRMKVVLQDEPENYIWTYEGECLTLSDALTHLNLPTCFKHRGL